LYSAVKYQQRTHCNQHALCGGPHSTCPPAAEDVLSLT
jgi:hypothetical protein